MESARVCAFGIAAEDAQGSSRSEESASGHALRRSADADRRQQWAAGGHVLLHQQLERVGDAMNGQRRLELETIGELLVRCKAGGLNLIEQRLAQAILQHVRRACLHWLTSAPTPVRRACHRAAAASDISCRAVQSREGVDSITSVTVATNK